MKITERELEHRKQRIREAAFRLFCKRGISDVTMSQIARAAHVGDTTIYRYFTNKPLLVLNTLSILWKEIGGNIERHVEQTGGYDEMNGLEQIAVQLRCCRQLYEKNSDYVLFSYESKLYLIRNQIPLTREQYDALMEEIKIHCIAALKKGKADGSIPIKRDFEDLFYAIWGVIRGYIVKIVIYSSLCHDGSPWQIRYHVVEEGILSALANGWNAPPLLQLEEKFASDSL